MKDSLRTPGLVICGALLVSHAFPATGERHITYADQPGEPSPRASRLVAQAGDHQNPLPAEAAPAPSILPPHDTYRMLRLSDKFYAEGAYYGDFNRDGHMDVVAGPFWFQGPTFETRHNYRPVKQFDPLNYSDNFLTYTGDFNRDGWTDILCVPWPGKEGFWYANPQGHAGHWPRHLVHANIGNESPTLADITGDAELELLFNINGHLGYAGPNKKHPNQPWQFHAISTQSQRYQRYTHGVGYGDINGDGRMDVTEAVGWWEQPRHAQPDEAWKFHPFQFAEAAAQMLVYDVDGDGLTDVVNSWHCHHYGLIWWQQTRQPNGGIAWKKNVILPPEPDLQSSEFRVSQLHALELVDMNGDGVKDILTGKRRWAHGPTGDVEPNAPPIVFWYEVVRNGHGGATFVPHLIDDHSGVGTQVAATDLNNDQRPDVIVANKLGIFVHLSKPGD